MTCVKCERGNMVLVTVQNKKETQERRGLVIAILTWPIRAIAWLYNYLFIGRDEKYKKKQFWNCTYCGAKKKDKGGFTEQMGDA